MEIDANELLSYQVKGLPKLSPKQANFFAATMNGMSGREAWLKYWCDPEQNVASISSCVTSIKNSVWYNKYKQYYLEQARTREANEIAWNLDLSILERRRLYSLNLLEVERLASAHDKAINYYITKKEEAMENDDEKQIEYYENKIIKELKAKNMSIASNQACLEALDGLDKLMGLQTVNMNHMGNVSFVGNDDMWNDGEEVIWDNVYDGQ